MPVLEFASTITSRGQTTVPAAIRRSLELSNDGGAIVFRLHENGDVVLARPARTEDPAIGAFLAFIASDIQDDPSKLRPLTASWLDELNKLVEGVETDLDEALSEENE